MIVTERIKSAIMILVNQTAHQLFSETESPSLRSSGTKTLLASETAATPEKMIKTDRVAPTLLVSYIHLKRLN